MKDDNTKTLRVVLENGLTAFSGLKQNRSVGKGVTSEALASSRTASFYFADRDSFLTVSSTTSDEDSTETVDVAVQLEPVLGQMEQSIAMEIQRCESAARELFTKLDKAKTGKASGTWSSNIFAAILQELYSDAKVEHGRAIELVRAIEKCAFEIQGMFQQDPALTAALQKRFKTRPWSQQAVSSIVVLFSDVFEALRGFEKASKSEKAGVWVAPDSFDRSTSKYWVEEANLTHLVLTCVGEAPLLVYGKSGRLSVEIPSFDQKEDYMDYLWGRFSTKVSSVYFDSPNLDLYRDRIARREGAQLLRARWYGARPTGDKPIFLELKTHHESWVQAKSVKERATILERDMAPFLSSSTKWNEIQAQKVLKSATPSIDGTKLNKATDLLLRMQSLVLKHKLRPCVRSTYDRLAFQSSSSNALRLTLDRNVIVSDETSALPGDWCVRDDSIVANKNCSRVVPFSVFEIKLGEGQTSNSLDELIQRGVILDAAKFSKFLTGAAIFCMHKVKTLPYWANHPAFADFFQKHTVPNPPKEEKVTSNDNEGPAKKRRGFSLFQKPNAKEPGTSKWIAPSKAVRVEPKTYFANERTFVQWISAAIFLISVSALLLEYENGRGHTHVASKVLLVFTIVVAVYALFLYYQRIHFIRNARPYGYVTHFGPMVLTVACVLGALVTLNDVWSIESDLTNGGVENTGTYESFQAMYEEKNQCLLHSISPFSPLDVEPSDILLDSDHGRLLVASMSDVLSFPAPIWTENQGLHIPGSSGEPFIAGEIPGADFEGLASIDGALYVMSEVDDSKTISHMFKFEWEGSMKLAQNDSWSVNLPQSEGLAFVNDPRKEGPQLYVSGNNGRVMAYDIPFTSSSGVLTQELLTGHALNTKILIQDLENPKIGAMRFFEGLLYILHDDARVVRVWDLSTGVMQAEWPLPLPSIGKGKQWEGFDLQRITMPTSLRGSEPESRLLLHLVQDTPAAIWTVVVQQGGTPGSFLYPPCAGVSTF